MISCSRRSSCGGRGGARHSRRSCVSSYCSSPTSWVRSLDQGGLKGSENSGTDFWGGRGRLGGKWKRSYGGHMSPSKHVHIKIYTCCQKLPGRHSLGGFEPKRYRRAVFFSPTLCSSSGPSSSTSTILEKVNDYEWAMDAVSECIAECSGENLLDLPSYYAFRSLPLLVPPSPFLLHLLHLRQQVIPNEMLLLLLTMMLVLFLLAYKYSPGSMLILTMMLVKCSLTCTYTPWC